MATREAENGLPWGIALRLAAQPQAVSPTLLLTIEDGLQVVAAAVWTPPHEVCVTRLPEGAAHLIATRCLATGLPMAGALGPEGDGLAVANSLAVLTNGTVVVRMRQRVYELLAVNEVPVASGVMRRTTMSDLDLVANWCAQFVREAGLPFHKDVRDWANAAITSGTAFVWVDGNAVESLACLSRETPNSRSIGPVYTPPNARRKGYATSLVAELSLQVLASGKRCAVLFTDANNPTSNHIYESIGYRFVCNYDAYTLRPPA